MLDFEIKHSRLDDAECILKGIAAHTQRHIHIPISIKQITVYVIFTLGTIYIF